MSRTLGITEEQLRDLPRYQASDSFSRIEKLVIAYADAISRAPVDVSDELYAELRKHFDEAQLVELTAAIAWENYRSRFNRAFEIDPQGFSEGDYCVVPERPD